MQVLAIVGAFLAGTITFVCVYIYIKYQNITILNTEEEGKVRRRTLANAG